MLDSWIANRTACVDSSGIRKVFDLAAKMEDPINLSIGQPDFDVPEPIREAAIRAVRDGKNSYSPTQGIAPLLERLQSDIDAEHGHSDRRVLVTSGTSGALVLAILAMVDPGDEVIVFDPYFVMYTALVGMVGGKCIFVDTYPDFRPNAAAVEEAITPRTKMLLLNSPANPTGVTAREEEIRDIAQLAHQHNIALVSDEIYSTFCYDGPAVTAAKYNEHAIVIDGFSKTYGMTGWRIGFAHGPATIIDKMAMLQQYTFVCAPQPLQWAALEALDVDMADAIASYRKRRDRITGGLTEAGYEVTTPGGAFYVFPKAPDGYASGTAFVESAIAEGLLIIPGNVFSQVDSHFRISYAASVETIERGVDVLQKLVSRKVN